MIMSRQANASEKGLKTLFIYGQRDKNQLHMNYTTGKIGWHITITMVAFINMEIEMRMKNLNHI